MFLSLSGVNFGGGRCGGCWIEVPVGSEGGRGGGGGGIGPVGSGGGGGGG